MLAAVQVARKESVVHQVAAVAVAQVAAHTDRLDTYRHYTYGLLGCKGRNS